MSDRPVMIQHLPVAEVDILGADDGSQTIFANGVLAELLTRREDEKAVQDAANEVEYDQLLELASPAGDLLRVVHKLATAVRLGELCLDREAGSYGAALSRLLGSTLADTIALRQAELRRRELLDHASTTEPKPATVGAVLDEMRGLHRSTAEFLAELAGRLEKLEAVREPERAGRDLDMRTAG